MDTIIFILPIVAAVVYTLRYLHKKEKINYILYMYFALFPFTVSNYSSAVYISLNNVLVVCGLIFFLMSSVIKKRTIFKFNLYMLLLIPIIILSIYNARDHSQLYDGLINFLFVVATYFYFTNNINKSNFEGIVNIFKINGVVLSLLALVEFSFEHTRVTGTYGNTNYFSMYLLSSFIFTYFTGGRKKSLLLIATAIFLTQSRSSIMGLVIPFLISKRFGVGKWIIFVFLVASSYFMGIFERFKAALSNGGDIIERKSVLQAAWHMFNDHPLLGVGYNNFITTFSSYSPYLDYTIGRDMIVTHNDFLRILAELGLIGSVAFVIYLIASLRGISKLEIQEDRHLGYSLLFATCLFSLFHNNLASIEFWMFSSIGSFLGVSTLKELRLQNEMDSHLKPNRNNVNSNRIIKPELERA